MATTDSQSFRAIEATEKIPHGMMKNLRSTRLAYGIKTVGVELAGQLRDVVRARRDLDRLVHVLAGERLPERHHIK